MPGMFDTLDERRERAQRPAQPAPAIVDPGRASAYALAALEGEVANLLAVPVGQGRNDQLNKSALKMYGYAEAGAISHQLVTETLGAADGGLDYDATRKTLQSAREAAARYGARHVPEPTAPAREASCPSDDPFSDNYVASSPAGTVGTTSPDDSPGTSSEAPSSDAATVPPSASTDSANADPLLGVEVAKVRRAREARRIVDHELAVADFRVPPYTETLADELAIPDEPVTFTVAEVIPAGANVLLTAQYKTGKTTLVNNLARSLVDGDPFLGVYDVTDLDGRVALFNYEVDGRQYRRWLRDAGIAHPDRVAVLNLRGYRLPLIVPHVENWVVEWLKAHEVAVWVVDPFARAAVGSVTSENDNTEVGTFLDALDVIKERAGVSDLILPTHTGRAVAEEGGERARGATRLDDWADVRWLLTRDKAGARYFRATGRDVDTGAEAKLGYDPDTRELTLVGGTRRDADERAIRHAILTVVGNNAGAGVTDIRNGARQMLGRLDNNLADAVRLALVDEGFIRVETHGRKDHHYRTVVVDPAMC